MVGITAGEERRGRQMTITPQMVRSVGKKLFRFLFKLVRLVLLCGIAYYILYPIVVKCLSAFMAYEDFFDKSVGIIPRHWSTKVIKVAMEAIRFPSAVAHSIELCIISVVTQVVSCTLVGYGFARFEFRGRKILFAAVILTLVIPAEVIITPLYINYRFFDPLGIPSMVTGSSLNLLNSIWPFVVNGMTCMGFRCGLYIYLLRQFYRGVPKELEDAALVDGAGHFTTFVRVMLPMGRPLIFVVAILSLVWQWTDTFYPSWFYPSRNILAVSALNLPTNATASLILQNNSASPDPILATILTGVGVLLLVVPLLVVYILTHKNLEGGIERSGIVG